MCSFAWSLGRSFTPCNWTQTTVGKQSTAAESWPIVGRQTTDKRPTVDRHTANSRPTDGRHLTGRFVRKLFFTVTLFLSAHINLILLIRYYVNRDTLFSYHKASEVFLQRLMALYVASHYKVIASFWCFVWGELHAHVATVLFLDNLWRIFHS